MKRAAFALFLLVFGGPLVSFYGCQNAMFHSKLESRGVTVTGTIEDGETRVSKHRLTGAEVSSKTTLYVTYTPKGAQEIYKKFPVTNEYMTGLMSTKVPVKYLPEDPTQAIIVGGSTEWGYLWWAGLLACALGSVAVYLCYKNDVFTSDD